MKNNNIKKQSELNIDLYLKPPRNDSQALNYIHHADLKLENNYLDKKIFWSTFI